MDDLGAAMLIAVSAIAVLVSFAALLWAAVADGRDEREFRAHHPELPR